MNQRIPNDYLTYLGNETTPIDFTDFWHKMRTNVQDYNLVYDLERQLNYRFENKRVYRLSLQALDKTKVIGWYIRSEKQQRYCLLTTHGYRSSKKQPHDYLYWVDSGFDVIVLDMRLKGGETGNNTPLSGPMSEVIALNILDLENSYLSLIHQDMMLATRLPEALGYEGYVLEGTSQAGGLSIAMGCIMQTASVVLANVPSNSNLDERIKNSKGSFRAFQTLCNDDEKRYSKVLQNLSYFDTKNMASWLKAPIVASVGGLDTTCPARDFFATYNRILGSKQIRYYPFSGHEGGGGVQTEQEIRYLQTFLEGR